MRGEVNRFGMYPDNTFAGHCEVSVLPDGKLEYRLFFLPFDGTDCRTVIIDPSNEEEMRGVRQLHLRPEIE